MRNNKGFSLVELIIVIAIMAILVGVMAPQLIKYIEKTNVSSDTQLCDTVKSAVTTAVMDPLYEYNIVEISTIDTKIKSAHGTGGIQYNIMGSNSVHVRIPNTDVNGKKNTSTGTSASLIIYVD